MKENHLEKQAILKKLIRHADEQGSSPENRLRNIAKAYALERLYNLIEDGEEASLRNILIDMGE